MKAQPLTSSKSTIAEPPETPSLKRFRAADRTLPIHTTSLDNSSFQQFVLGGTNQGPPQPSIPMAEPDSRELSPEERRTFEDLGYTGDLKAFQSKSMANLHRWFVGEDRNKFGCWLDKPIKNGFVYTHDGRMINKSDLAQPFYKPWSNDPNTNFFSHLIKEIETIKNLLKDQSYFNTNMNARVTKMEDYLESLSTKEGGEIPMNENGEITHY